MIIILEDWFSRVKELADRIVLRDPGCMIDEVVHAMH